MANITQGDVDPAVQAIKVSLDDYEARHPGSEASLYRRNNASIRLRVIDSRFEGMSKSRRHADVWDFLAERVPEETLSEVSLILALPPTELTASFANHEFDHPIPSTL